MIDSWRYIPLIEASGQIQMSIDLYLLNKYIKGGYPSILRFYIWSPIAISLGYHQHNYPAHWNELAYEGKSLEIIRRPTGGRAVLHQGDLCYSLITEALPGSFRQGYMNICQFLQLGWQSLGVNLNYGLEKKNYANHPNCFGTSTFADLVDNSGEKRIGSAQLRRKNAILQQGSMSLGADPELYKTVFQNDPPTRIDLSQSLIIEQLEKSAAFCLKAKLVKQSLQDPEWEYILSRITDKLHIVNS
jgi:lipoate-protein ligase A